jgi:hypothetical protein
MWAFVRLKITGVFSGRSVAVTEPNSGGLPMPKFAPMPLFALLFLVNTSSIACDLVYEVRRDDDVSELCVTIEKKADGTTYRSIFKDVKQLYHYNHKNLMTRWEYANGGANTDFKAERRSNIILIRGISNGQPLDKSLDVGQETWLQNSEFGLLGFLTSKEKSKDFFVVAPEDMSIKKIRATQPVTEQIDWNDQTITAVKLTARLRGFFSLIWQATYWYRSTEKTFLRYKADGLPGIPKVDILLVSEKGLQ